MNYLFDCIIADSLAKKLVNFSRYLLKTIVDSKKTTGLCQSRTELFTSNTTIAVIRRKTPPTVRTMIIGSLNGYPAENSVNIAFAVLHKLHRISTLAGYRTALIAVGFTVNKPL